MAKEWQFGLVPLTLPILWDLFTEIKLLYVQLFAMNY
jgi:hypothetical protein